MRKLPPLETAAHNGAIGGAAAAALLALTLALAALCNGESLPLPGLIEAAGGRTNGAASVQFTLEWVAPAATAAAGSVIAVLRRYRRKDTTN
jgi:hypothetical protein